MLNAGRISLPSSLQAISAAAKIDNWEPVVATFVALAQRWTTAMQTVKTPAQGTTAAARRIFAVEEGGTHGHAVHVFPPSYYITGLQ